MDIIKNESEPNEQRKGLKKLEQHYEKNIQALLSLAELVQQYKENALLSLRKLEKEIFQKTSLLIEMKNQISYLQTSQEIFQQENKLNYMIMQLNEDMGNQFKKLESDTKLDKLYSSLNNFKSDNIQTNDINLSYQLISSYPQKLYSVCMNFNRNGKLLIAASYKSIKVFEINKNKLKEVLQLNGHSNEVLCLKFLNKSDSFISSGKDGSVIFWEKSQFLLWKNKQILTNESINRIIINSNDDLLIFGTTTNKISLWHKNHNTWNFNQSIDCESQILNINLNNSEDQLIVDVYEKQILIIQLNNQEWNIIQKIPLDLCGCGLCSINSKQFMFKPQNKHHLQIFDYDPLEQKFIEGQQIKYSDKVNDGFELFPIRYVSSVGLIMLKNNSSVYIFKRNQNGQFSVQQTLQFDCFTIIGDVTNDGRFIVTWDNSSYEIQLRILEY